MWAGRLSAWAIVLWKMFFKKRKWKQRTQREMDGDRKVRRLQIVRCWLAMCDDDDVIKWTPVCWVWINCVCVSAAPVGVLGFVIQPNIPVRWLNDRNWVRCPPHPRLFLSPSVSAPYHCQYPFPLYHSPNPPSASHPHSTISSSWLTSEQIAGSLGNPCLGPCYQDHFIILPLDLSQHRYLRPVCVLSFALGFLSLLFSFCKSLSSGNRNRGCAGSLQPWGGGFVWDGELVWKRKGKKKQERCSLREPSHRVSRGPLDMLCLHFTNQF